VTPTGTRGLEPSFGNITNAAMKLHKIAQAPEAKYALAQRRRGFCWASAGPAGQIRAKTLPIRNNIDDMNAILCAR